MPRELPVIDFLATNRKAKLFRHDASYIYRCENIAIALTEMGHETGMHHAESYRIGPSVRAVVLHRPRFSLKLQRLVNRLKRRCIPVLADVDDLIFDRELAAFSPAVIGGHKLSAVRKLFTAHRRGLALADHLITSTSELETHLKRAFPRTPTAVLPNAVHINWRTAEPSPLTVPADPKIITYCPGTRSHDSDFPVAGPSVLRFLERHPNVHLQITGHLNHTLPAMGGRISHRPKLLFDSYPDCVRAGWVNLLPLQDTPFNACKSALKVIEAGYWNVPTVCSAIPDADRFGDAGALIARDADGWLRALDDMLDADKYNARVTDLRARTLAVADVYEQAGTLLSCIDSVAQEARLRRTK